MDVGPFDCSGWDLDYVDESVVTETINSHIRHFRRQLPIYSSTAVAIDSGAPRTLIIYWAHREGHVGFAEELLRFAELSPGVIRRRPPGNPRNGGRAATLPISPKDK